ncbi:hypothetical protein V5799_005096 [Amblyomma americanum]|uniref:Histone deacetylase complex subunit SAP130 C-terminal domain-containing protein n=1 Tax=Amblyomma americanum TaxID=6943 RepID=A0AAQ4E081_AMBAM
MASLNVLKPAIRRSARCPSTSATATPQLGSDIQQQITNAGNTTSDLVLPDASKSSLPLLNTKQEPPAKRETPSDGNALGSPGPSTSVEEPPRKRLRKQRFQENELLETNSSDGQDLIEKKSRKNKKKGPSRRGRKKARALSNRKKNPAPRRRSLTWNTRLNLFTEHSKVKPKDDKKQTVNYLASQKDVLQRVNGWKVFHLSTQIDEVVNLEDTVQSQLSELRNCIQEKAAAVLMEPLDMEEEEILSKINELTERNIQQSKTVQEQACEAKQKMLNFLEHKPRVVEVIGSSLRRVDRPTLGDTLDSAVTYEERKAIKSPYFLTA